MAESNKAAILKSMLNELVKTRLILDGQSRTQFVYQAASDAKDGAVALITEYLYSTPTSTTIVGTKETEGTWDSSWDSDFTL